MANVAELHINGSTRQVNADPERSLLQVLREDLDLTGAKYGCGEGRCGACTVLLDGRPVRSCVTRVGAAEGKQIQTIEGLAQDGRLHPVQESFIQHDAMQCGYCTPGMIMSAVALLASNPAPDEDEIRRSMNGNICRCGTYMRILAAIRDAAKVQKAGAHDR
jgi:aerobic-type carbon monoxide dehydrogenase small subunit (CoxS/CutS family)